jgi:hypothetical protein
MLVGHDYAVNTAITLKRSVTEAKGVASKQRNGLVVRRLVGYDRYSSRAAQTVLQRLYGLLRLPHNFFRPVRKLLRKWRVGSHVSKHYDAALTPYQRVLAAGVLTTEQQQGLAREFQPATSHGPRLTEEPSEGAMASLTIPVDAETTGLKRDFQSPAPGARVAGNVGSNHGLDLNQRPLGCEPFTNSH